MEGNTNRIWLVYRRSKKEPVRIEAASVKSVSGQYIFTDAAGGEAGRYDITAVEGYSIEPEGASAKPGITVLVDRVGGTEG